MEATLLQDDVYVMMKQNAPNYSYHGFERFWVGVVKEYGVKLKRDEIYTLEMIADKCKRPVAFFLFKCYGRQVPEEVTHVGAYLKFMT